MAHAHGHGDHVHAARHDDRRRLLIVLALSSIYMFAEAAGGLITGSLALLADAGHMLSDVASLVLGLFAVWAAQRPATSQRTYGHTRVEILAALVQGVTLVAVSLMIAIEAFDRFGRIGLADGRGMMLFAAGALVIESIGLLVLSGGRKQSINIRGVWLHVASDALGSLGVMAAGFCIWMFGWYWADPAVSLLISALVLVAAWQLIRDAVDILMEGAPGHLDVDEIREALLAHAGVDGLHDLHVWTIGNGHVSLSSHLVAPADGDHSELLRDVRTLLQDRFGIHHTTVQIEPAAEQPDCDGACDELEAAIGPAGTTRLQSA